MLMHQMALIEEQQAALEKERAEMERANQLAAQKRGEDLLSADLSMLNDLSEAQKRADQAEEQWSLIEKQNSELRAEADAAKSIVVAASCSV